MTKEETLKHFKTWCQQTLGNNCSDKDFEMANNIMALLEQEPCDDCISKQEILKKQYRIDDSATLSTRDVVNVDDIENLPPITPQPKYFEEDISIRRATIRRQEYEEWKLRLMEKQEQEEAQE